MAPAASKAEREEYSLRSLMEEVAERRAAASVTVPAEDPPKVTSAAKKYLGCGKRVCTVSKTE